jgi:hypothetical protein
VLGGLPGPQAMTRSMEHDKVCGVMLRSVGWSMSYGADVASIRSILVIILVLSYRVDVTSIRPILAIILVLVAVAIRNT